MAKKPTSKSTAKTVGKGGKSNLAPPFTKKSSGKK